MIRDLTRNILLVDDQEAFLTTLASELRECGNRFCILTAENGDRALKVLESERVDLVVTDLRMPVMNGFELLSHMKERYPGVPVIAMSTFMYPELEVKLRTLGVFDCINKASFSISGLVEMIVKGCGC